GVEAAADIRLGAPAVVNDPLLVAHTDATIRDRLGPDAVYRIPRPSMGGEDFAHYAQHVPGLLVRVGTAAGPDTQFPLHHARFDLDERALAPTAELMANVLLDHVNKRVSGLGSGH